MIGSLTYEDTVSKVSNVTLLEKYFGFLILNVKIIRRFGKII